MSALRPAQPRMTSMAWYLVAAGLFVSGVGIAAIGASQWFSTLEGMQRIAMPGKAEIILPAGPTTLYGETQSVVEGKMFAASRELSFQCQVIGPGGAPVTLVAPTARVSYSAAGYTGQNAFDLHAETAGTHTLECEASEPFVAAIGHGMGSWLVVGLVGGGVPAGLGVLVFLLVLLKRSGQKRRLALATPVPPGA